MTYVHMLHPRSIKLKRFVLLLICVWFENLLKQINDYNQVKETNVKETNEITIHVAHFFD